MNEPPQPKATAPPGPEPETDKAIKSRLSLETAEARARAAKASAAATEKTANARIARLEAKHRHGTRIRVDDEDWRERLLTAVDRDGDTYVMPILANVVTILRYHPKWARKIAWDAFGERVVVTEKPPWDPAAAPEKAEPGAWSDSDVARVVDWLARNERLHVWTGCVIEAVNIVAEANVVHPVLDYLDALPKWDGVPRLGTWLATYVGADANEYTSAIGTRWMISAVARVKRPGCQVDCMIVAEGIQGVGKSSMFRTLVPSLALYSETGIDLGDKDSYQCLHGIWIYLMDELDSLRKGETTKVKNFISSPKDHYRQSYGRAARDFYRQNVFAGTTNEREYLVDKTGNRRIWPFKVIGTIDLVALARDRDLLWAEALHRYADGERWHVDTPELRALCEAEQSERVHADPWEPLVLAWLGDPDQEQEYETEHGTRRRRVPFKVHPDGPSTAEVLQHAIRMRPDAIDRGRSMRAGEVLRSLGYTVITSVRTGDGETRVRRYSKYTNGASIPPPNAGGTAGTSPAQPESDEVVPDDGHCFSDLIDPGTTGTS